MGSFKVGQKILWLRRGPYGLAICHGPQPFRGGNGRQIPVNARVDGCRRPGPDVIGDQNGREQSDDRGGRQSPDQWIYSHDARRSPAGGFSFSYRQETARTPMNKIHLVAPPRPSLVSFLLLFRGDIIVTSEAGQNSTFTVRLAVEVLEAKTT